MCTNADYLSFAPISCYISSLARYLSSPTKMPPALLPIAACQHTLFFVAPSQRLFYSASLPPAHNPHKSLHNAKRSLKGVPSATLPSQTFPSPFRYVSPHHLNSELSPPRSYFSSTFLFHAPVHSSQAQGKEKACRELHTLCINDDQ